MWRIWVQIYKDEKWELHTVKDVKSFLCGRFQTALCCDLLHSVLSPTLSGALVCSDILSFKIFSHFSKHQLCLLPPSLLRVSFFFKFSSISHFLFQLFHIAFIHDDGFHVFTAKTHMDSTPLKQRESPFSIYILKCHCHHAAMERHGHQKVPGSILGHRKK